MTQRGGPRPGAGARPKYSSGKMQPLKLYLPAEYRAAAERLGGGNAAEGVRLALAPHVEGAPVERTVQVWRRKADGARFAVLLDGGVPVAAQALADGEQPDAAAWDGALSDQMAEREGEYDREGVTS